MDNRRHRLSSARNVLAPGRRHATNGAYNRRYGYVDRNNEPSGPNYDHAFSAKCALFSN